MSVRIQRIWGVVLLALAVCFATFCLTFASVDLAFADAAVTDPVVETGEGEAATGPALDADPAPVADPALEAGEGEAIAGDGAATSFEEDVTEEYSAALGDNAQVTTNATNGDPLSPYYGSKFVDISKKFEITNEISVTGFEPNREYELSTNFHFYYEGKFVQSSGGFMRVKFTTDEQGAASLTVTRTLNGNYGKPIDTVRCVLIFYLDNEEAGVHDDPDQGLTVQAEPEPVSVSVIKAWTEDDGTTEADPPADASATLQLYADGVEYGDPVTRNAETGWFYVWVDLPAVHLTSGDPIEYTVDEIAYTGDGFAKGAVAGDMASSFTITNTRKPTAILSTTATNAADGGKTIPRSADAVISDTIVYEGIFLGRTYTVKSLLFSEATSSVVCEAVTEFTPETSDGEVTVEIPFDASACKTGEELVVLEYISSVDGLVVASHEDPFDAAQTVNVGAATTVSVSVAKAWAEADGTTPAEPPAGASVTLQLYADGAECREPVTLSAETGWECTWVYLPETGAGGARVAYTVAETAFEAEGFEAGEVTGDATGGFVITNTRAEEPPVPTVSVTAAKAWAEADGSTPAEPPAGASVTLQLYADGEACREPVTLTAETGWECTWAYLPETGAGGEAVAYTVEETAFVADGFEAGGVTGDMGSGFVITNTRAEEPPAPTVSVTASKAWAEADGTTPAEPPAGATVTLQLLSDGVDYGVPVTVSAAEGWAHTWAGLPRASGKTGRDAVYAVRETGCSSADFELASVGGDMSSGFTVTNRRKAPSIARTGDDTNLGLIAGVAAAGVALAGWGVAQAVRRGRRDK